MEALQIICTYRKKGLFFKEGFKTLALSDGVQNLEKKEIESLASIEVSNIKDKDEYMCFYKLSTGRYIISKIKNNILHGFISKDDLFDFYPIQLFNSNSFINDEYELEPKKFGTTNLPSVSNLEINPKITIDYISEFIKEKTGITLRDMINALLLYSKDKKPLIINDEKVNIPYWIAALQMAFPIDMAHQVSFSTSGKLDLIDKYTLIISDIIDLDSLPNSIKQRSYFFDLSNYIKSSIDLDYRFNRLVDYGYLVSNESIYAFHDFLNKFNFREINNNIEYIYNFYTISTLGIGNMEDDILIQAVNFCKSVIKEECVEEIIEKMSLIFEKISREINIYTSRYILEFLFSNINNVKNLILIDRVFKFMNDCIDSLMFECEGISGDSVYNLYNELININPERVEGLRKYLINSNKVDYVTYRLIEKEHEESYYVYFRIFLENLSLLNFGWNDLDINTKYKQFINLCVSKTINKIEYVENILGCIIQKYDIFFNIFSLYYDAWQGIDRDTVLPEIFSDIVKNIDMENLINIRRKINSVYNGEFLYREYICSINKAEDTKKYFREYYKWVILEVPDYGKLYYSDVIKEYLNINKNNLEKHDYVEIINSIYNPKFEIQNDVLLDIIDGMESIIELKQPEEDDIRIISILDRIKKERNIQTVPDIITYVNFGVLLKSYYDERASYTFKDITRNKVKVEGLNKNMYVEYLNWCIPNLIYFIRFSEDHKSAAYMFKMPEMDNEYFEIYLKCINELIKEDSDRGYNVLLSFIVYFFFYLEPQYRYLEEIDLLNNVFNEMINNIKALPRNRIDAIDNDVREEFNNEGLSIPIQWNELYSKIR